MLFDGVKLYLFVSLTVIQCLFDCCRMKNSHACRFLFFYDLT